MLLKIKHLDVYYKKAQALKDVSLSVANGEIATIIGSNGAGKSTILKTIIALVRPTRGSILFEGHQIESCSPEEVVKKGISICMEGRRLFPYMTVLENIEMGAFCRKDKNQIKKDLKKVLNQFPVLSERTKQKAGTLSGGEQQMLTIARALMSNPKILLLDEPTVGLAPLVVEEVGKIVKKLNKNGITILLVEQNAQLALKLAHKCYVIEVGNIIMEADPKSLLKNDYVRQAYLG